MSQPMSRDEVRRQLLISAAEDYEPMFHALWEFGVPADPVPGAPTADEIKATLWELIEDGLVELFQGESPDGKPLVLPRERRMRVYLDPATWEVREDPATDVRYSSTPAGDAALQ